MDLLALHNKPEDIDARTAAIRDAVLRASDHISEGNFERVHEDDVARMFRLYDTHFLEGWLERAAVEASGEPLTFRLSSRATRAGGKTIVRRRRAPDGKPRVAYEIVIASRLLFMTFSDIRRPVMVCGHACRDRLDAMQRIMEHEIIHLAEFVAWSKSSCRAKQFHGLARRIFGHTGFHHDLVTPGEAAAVKFNVAVGSVVEFECEGRVLTGRVNRIVHRATVLVNHSDGQRYTDGKRYRKYYVPLALLRKTGSSKA